MLYHKQACSQPCINGVVRYMLSSFYTGSVVLFKLHGCEVSHVLIIATPFLIVHNWASEASPTLGCSIEISRDICMYIY